MPEYLAPGVYVEEVSFRAKSIEGVSTSVAGFIGATRFGPVGGESELLTSFTDFARIYGGIDRLMFQDTTQEEAQDNYMAHAVRAFFDNGGSKLYVTRIYEPEDTSDPDSGKASFSVGSPLALTLRARFPGEAGEMRIVFAARTSANLLVAADPPGAVPRVNSVRENDVVFIKDVRGGGTVQEGLYDVVKDGDDLAFDDASPGLVRLSDLDPTQHRVHLVTLSVRVLRPGRFEDEQVWDGLSPHPKNRNALMDLFTREPESRRRYLTIPFAIEPVSAITSGAQLAEALLGQDVLDALSLNLYTDDELEALSPATERPRPSELEVVYTLTDGSDGKLPTAEAYKGREGKRDATSGKVQPSTGLETFADVEEISIVAAPGSSKKSALLDTVGNNRRWSQIIQHLLVHCEERMRYRVAVMDSPNDQVVSEVQVFRGQFDSTHAALYYPWVKVLDPLDPDGRKEILLSPSGFVAGIYARTDVRHGVFKAPANEVVLGAIGFETLLNKAQQDILNPQGINCFRFFEGRGFRLWGARTISSDPEWKYVNVRRYFAYLEHSIDRGTQWAVFENNNEALWANVRRTVEDFLFNEWKNGALMGTKPEEAFFVRCVRSTMTQNDLDNGRLVCLIGVAVVKPAEFVIFRIGQFTADSRR
jgi:phage tail sheath protein FI